MCSPEHLQGGGHVFWSPLYLIHGGGGRPCPPLPPRPTVGHLGSCPAAPGVHNSSVAPPAPSPRSQLPCPQGPNRGGGGCGELERPRLGQDEEDFSLSLLPSSPHRLGACSRKHPAPAETRVPPGSLSLPPPMGLAESVGFFLTSQPPPISGPTWKSASLSVLFPQRCLQPVGVGQALPWHQLGLRPGPQQGPFRL